MATTSEKTSTQSGARHLIVLDRFRKLDMPQMPLAFSMPDVPACAAKTYISA